MKYKQLFVILLSIALFLTACQPQVQEPVQTAYPLPEQVSQPAATKNLESSPVLYPSLQDGQSILWAQVEAMALNSEIARIVEGESINVTITLKDGRTFASTLPSSGYVSTFIQTCGDVCKSIEVVKE
ncbi:MAG TPA: hypothetical protein VLM80_04620 [Anaerolineales bacterium]|nr:hypothetical protein [Anaerolineales bacterium]